MVGEVEVSVQSHLHFVQVEEEVDAVREVPQKKWGQLEDFVCLVGSPVGEVELSGSSQGAQSTVVVVEGTPSFEVRQVSPCKPLHRF